MFEIGHYGRVLRYVLLRDALRNLSLEPSPHWVQHPATWVDAVYLGVVAAALIAGLARAWRIGHSGH